MYHLKRDPAKVTHCGTKIKSEAVHPYVTVSPNLPRDTRVKVARPLRTPVAQKYARTNVAYSQTEHMFILGT
jgi:hypothetical protein